MCGIAGFINPNRANAHGFSDAARSMVETLGHRGPDDSGLWIDDTVGIALGHRRLAIIDLSQGGSQPMVSACSRYVAAFNGEIYNYLEIRRNLEGSNTAPAWCGHSDQDPK